MVLVLMQMIGYCSMNVVVVIVELRTWLKHQCGGAHSNTERLKQVQHVQEQQVLVKHGVISKFW